MNSYTKFEEFSRQSGNEILMLIKGHNSSTYLMKITHFNPKPFLPDINYYTKLEEYWSINAHDRARKQKLNVNKGE